MVLNLLVCICCRCLYYVLLKYLKHQGIILSTTSDFPKHFAVRYLIKIVTNSTEGQKSGNELLYTRPADTSSVLVCLIRRIIIIIRGVNPCPIKHSTHVAILIYLSDYSIKWGSSSSFIVGR